MVAIQMISAQIARVTGKGLAPNMRAFGPRWIVVVLVLLLATANTIDIAADLAAMGAAIHLLVRGAERFYVAALGAMWRSSFSLQLAIAREFYSVILIAIVGGVAITFLHLDPLKALYWSAVINGLAAVPIMVVAKGDSVPRQHINDHPASQRGTAWMAPWPVPRWRSTLAVRQSLFPQVPTCHCPRIEPHQPVDSKFIITS